MLVTQELWTVLVLCVCVCAWVWVCVCVCVGCVSPGGTGRTLHGYRVRGSNQTLSDSSKFSQDLGQTAGKRPKIHHNKYITTLQLVTVCGYGC